MQNDEEVIWPHNLSYILRCLTDTGLQFEFLHEFPFLTWKILTFLELQDDGFYYYPESFSEPKLPLQFSLKFFKPTRLRFS